MYLLSTQDFADLKGSNTPNKVVDQSMDLTEFQERDS
ncbi:hypothetical protein NQ317_015491, partial [Molorchus minor]